MPDAVPVVPDVRQLGRPTDVAPAHRYTSEDKEQQEDPGAQDGSHGSSSRVPELLSEDPEGLGDGLGRGDGEHGGEFVLATLSCRPRCHFKGAGAGMPGGIPAVLATDGTRVGVMGHGRHLPG